MGRRSRRKSGPEDGLPTIPDAEVQLKGGGSLSLRCVMTPRTREQYRTVRSGLADAPGASREDAWQRAVEYLFERLVTRWEAAGVVYEDQRELLMRFRAASQQEREDLRAALRAHLAEWFPELDAP